MKRRVFLTAKAMTEPWGLTPGASGSIEASLTQTFFIPRTCPKLSAAQRGCSPMGTVEHRCTVITVALVVAKDCCRRAMSAFDHKLVAGELTSGQNQNKGLFLNELIARLVERLG